ncbi:helix-turn-helix domain-containing protein [Flavobacterium pallidum]|uniref:HTH araC/xylS-type domain-containing protein n=1 Tax=Flavobacterium pallidum TaxID=2172098 RepID=A0A2S1SIR4_9FLAO|nr:helix-turn-helix domain-containing protein [Flavobacterium pallidum]AWI26232.1 hypothetical protein HYN49_10145 [Flavobacterium pallidum]
MKNHYHKPNLLLAACVNSVLVMEGFSGSDANSLPVFTNGLPTMVCRTEKDGKGKERLLQWSLFGKSPSVEDWKLGLNATTIVYFFKPFEMACLFNISSDKLSEIPFDLSDWNASKYNELQQQLMHAKSPSEKLSLFDNLLISEFHNNKQISDIIRHATDTMMLNPDAAVLPEILNTLNINERTLQRLFKKYIGVTPTQYRRACQFQLSFGQLHANRFDKISDVAFDSGFSDQSHFIRSFREFTSITPNDYVKNGLKGKKG